MEILGGLADSDRFSFVGFVSKEFADTIDLKKFASYAKEHFGIKGGGGSQTPIQGGGQHLRSNLKESIISWIEGIL